MIDDLKNALVLNDVKFSITNKPFATVSTPFGYVRIEMKSYVADTIEQLVEQCKQYPKVWIYSVEQLAASGKMMLRYTWVN